ncbi:MAG TPA: hypothetical protein VF156_15455 [Agromyces sp.]
MLDLDLDKFKARRAWKQLSFYVALAPILLALLPTEARDWIAAHWQAVAASSGPLVAWLIAQGYVRGQGAAAAGEVAKSQTVMEPLLPSHDELADDPIDPPDVAGGLTAGYDEGVDAEGER